MTFVTRKTNEYDGARCISRRCVVSGKIRALAQKVNTVENYKEVLRHLSGTDWGTMLGVGSGGAFCPSNIDGIVERNGHCLFLEIKQPTEHSSVGQQIMLRALDRLPGCKVIVVTVDGSKTSIGASRFLPIAYQAR